MGCTQVVDAIDAFKLQGYKGTDAAYCAAHLNMLCKKAIDAMEHFGLYRDTGTDLDGSQRGLMVDYAGLPGAIPRVMLPLFGVDSVEPLWVSKMEESAQFYSKGGRKKSNQLFSGDSEEKDAKADKDVKEAAAVILQPAYETLTKMATDSIFAMRQQLIGGDLTPGARLDPSVLWSEVISLPVIKGIEGGAGSLVGSAQAPHVPPGGFKTLASLSPDMDLLWKSFASNHSSKPFEVRLCFLTILH